MEDIRDEYQRFRDDYVVIWKESGMPSRADIQEFFLAALDGQESGSPLGSFFVAKLAEGTPLNWFCGEVIDELMYERNGPPSEEAFAIAQRAIEERLGLKEWKAAASLPR